MNIVTRQRIQVERHRRHERFTFAGGHFRNVTAMQHNATENLHIKWHHLPPVRISAYRPLAATHPPASVLHRRKRLRQEFVEDFLLQCLRLTLNRFRIFGPEFAFKFPDFGVKRRHATRLPGCFNALLKFRRLRPQFIVAQLLILDFNRVDLRHHRPKFFDFALVFRTDNFLQNPTNHFSFPVSRLADPPDTMDNWPGQKFRFVI